MAKLWQLRKISTGENISEPQVLPENWGPIFGMHGFTEKLSNLYWLGKSYYDMGWFETGTEDIKATPSTPEELVWNEAKKLLADSDWAVLPDVIMTKGERESWIQYRKKLREIRLQPGFPNDIIWPKRPD